MKIINSKIFKLIVILFILGFILGIFGYFIIDKSYYDTNINNYFSMIKDINKFKYLINSIIHNYKYLIIIWISGIILISYLIVPFISILNGFTTSLIFTGIICNYGMKGILFCLILLFPCILINNFIFILSNYYSINISNKIVLCIKRNKSINIKLFFKNYFYILIIFLIILLLSSFIETYISLKLIKYVL